jgi:hypothetical protein
MALFKYSHYLTNSADSSFDPAHPAGAMAPHSGIYKCQGCGREVTSNMGHPLPPQDHHQHGLEQGAIGWRLIVAAV